MDASSNEGDIGEGDDGSTADDHDRCSLLCKV